MKRILWAVPLAALMAVSSAQAADPVKACGTSLVKAALSDLFKAIAKAADGGCKGKDPVELDAKLVAKVNKTIEKTNKVDEKLDCNANADPDVAGAATWPVDPLPVGTLTGTIASVATICNGADD